MSRKSLLAKTARKANYSYFPYQERMILDILECKSNYIYNASHPGCGKTCISYGVAYNRAVSSMLVVCPACLRINWLRESCIWGGPNLEAGLAILSIKDLDFIKKRGFWKDGMIPSLVIVSYDMLVKNPAVKKYVMSRVWDMVVFDEADSCANLTSGRTNIMLELCKKNKYAHFLSGTPLRNSAADMYPHLNVIVPPLDYVGKGAKRLCTSFEDYTNTFTFKYVGRYGPVYKKVRNKEVFRELVRNRIQAFFRVTKEEVLPDLPDKTYEQVEISLDVDSGDVNVDAFLEMFEVRNKKRKP